MTRVLPSLAFIAVLAGCTSQQLYSVTQGWQHQECQRIADRDERQRCEKSSAMSYEQYRREREAAKQGTPAK
mgnify:CR=1 FL=1